MELAGDDLKEAGWRIQSNGQTLLITQTKVRLLCPTCSVALSPIRFPRDAQTITFFKEGSFTESALPRQIALPDLSFQTNCRVGQKFAIHKKPSPQTHRR